MRTVSYILASLLLTLAAACGGEPQAETGWAGAAGGKADSVQVTPTLVFDAQWNEQASGTLHAGGKLRIDYDEARLPDCRAYHNGNPGWQITAYLRFLPAGTEESAELFAHAVGPTGTDYYSWVKQVPEVQIPADATEVEVWFKNESAFDHPCTAWDSDYGNNYRFPVSPAAVDGTLSFTRGWTVEQQGTVQAGGRLAVEYDAERMTKIANGNDYFSFFASKYHCYGYGCCSHDYDTRLQVRFQDSGAFAEHAVTAGQPVLLDVPSDASRVEIFFRSEVWTTTWYCGGTPGPKYTQPSPDTFYDSDFGKNYVFNVQ